MFFSSLPPDRGSLSSLSDSCLAPYCTLLHPWFARPKKDHAMIETRQLTKIFQDKKRGAVAAVDHLDFRCQPGKVFGLLGVNGAGKTTCLRLLATVLRPTAGSATVNGFDVLREPQKVRASIGFLSAATALYGRLTAYEVVQYFGRLHGMTDASLRPRMDALFQMLEMNEFRDRRCDKLSTG